jgi:hypothetical protein
MLNNFRAIIQSCIRNASIIPVRPLVIHSSSSPFKSLQRMPLFHFCSKIDYLKSEKTFELLVGKLKGKVDYCEELEQELNS